MRDRGTMTSLAGVELSVVLGVILAVTACGAPLLDHVQARGRLAFLAYEPPQCHTWNPYDCRFWQELPPAEFGPG